MKRIGNNGDIESAIKAVRKIKPFLKEAGLLQPDRTTLEWTITALTRSNTIAFNHFSGNVHQILITLGKQKIKYTVKVWLSDQGWQKALTIISATDDLK